MDVITKQDKSGSKKRMGRAGFWRKFILKGKGS
jgi:hypothetical protein